GVEAIANEGCRGDAARAHTCGTLQGQDRRQGRHADARRAWRLPEVGKSEGGLLAERRGAAFDPGGTLNKLSKRKKPGRWSRPGFDRGAHERRAIRSVANANRADDPAVAVPI